MAIEQENMQDREHWANVSRHWYSKTSDQIPATGRLYHHLGILAERNVLQQLFYYGKALLTPNPFPPASESIMRLFGRVIINVRRLYPPVL